MFLFDIVRDLLDAQWFRFVLAGCPGTLLFFIALYMMIERFKVREISAIAIASILNSALNFVLQKFWAFGAIGMEHLMQEMLEYVPLAVFQAIGNPGLAWLAKRYLLPENPARYWYFAVTAITGLILTGIAYLASGWIFL